MAARAKNAHWKMRDILRRQWIALGARHGIVTEDGREVQFILDDLIARTPGVVASVRAKAAGRLFRRSGREYPGWPTGCSGQADR